MEEKRNKKIWIIVACIVLAVALILACVSCAAGGNEEDPAPTGDTSTTAPTGETPDDSSTPADGTEGADEVTEPTGETSSDEGTEGIEGVEKPTEPVEKPTEGTEKPTEPVENPTEPTVKPTEPEHTHKYTEKVVAAGCDSEGYTVYTCSCGDTYRDGYTPAMGHSWGSWVTTKEPTTTATGVAVRTCSRCKDSETKELPKVVENHTHKYTSKVTKAATCTAEGVKTFTCTCGQSYTESIPKAAHQYATQVLTANCDCYGCIVHYCVVCGDFYDTDIVPALGHNYQQTATKAATCTAKGTKTFKCSRCSHILLEDIPALGHNYKQTAYTAPTCTKTGSKTETCSRCSDKCTSEVATAPHNWAHHHEDGEGHVEEILRCNCGWMTSEGEANKNGYTDVGEYYYMVHVKEFPLEKQWDHSYDSWGEWVVTKEAVDYDYCTHCGVHKGN